MKIELLVKEVERPEKDQQDEVLKELLGKKTSEEDQEQEVVYNPYVVDLRDVILFGASSDGHTKIFMPMCLLYAQIHYDTFYHIYQAAMGTQIKKVSDFQMISR